MTRFPVSSLSALTVANRHDHMVRRFSRDPQLIVHLRGVGADRSTTTDLIRHLTALAGVPTPEVTFHGGRGPHSGYCRPPRAVAVSATDEATIVSWERSRGSAWPENGMIRLGDPTSLATIAHELAHHYVHALEPIRTAPHGKRWVEHFDETAGQIAAEVALPGQGPEEP